MENIQLKKGHGEIEVNAFGLKLRVSPRQLLQGIMSKNSQKILDSMIEEKYRQALNFFDDWYENGYIPDENKDIIKETERLNQKWKNEDHVISIQKLADITRDLIPLHSDGEIELINKDQELADKAAEFWKYNVFYGFKGTEEAKI